MRQTMLPCASLLLASCAAVIPGHPTPRTSHEDTAPTPTRAAAPAERSVENPAAASSAGANRRSTAANVDLFDTPQETDYSLTALFNEEHGDFKLKYEAFQPDAIVRAQVFPEYEIDSEAGDFDLFTIEFDGEKDLIVSHNAFLTFGGSVGSRRYDVGTLVGFFDETLYKTTLKFGGGFFADPDFLVEGIFEPGLWSDFDGTVHSEDFDWYGSILGTWRSRDDLYLKVGARYNEVYVDANVLPWLGLSWIADPEWRVDILLPEKAEVSWLPDGATTLSLGMEVQGAQYHMRNSPGMGKTRFDINVQEILVYLGGSYRFDDYVSTHARVGLTVAGDYKLRDGFGGSADGTLDPGFFAELGLGFTF